MTAEFKTMRDVAINRIYNKMKERNDIFFLSADLGAIALDELRTNFKERFINVGIAEQNLINISTGLALEGFIVYSYAIVPFLTMRAYEQIKNNISLLSQIKDINVNLMGVGAGLSYDISGPSHHGIEDISIMMTLPNIMIFSPSDCIITKKIIDFSIDNNKPKYIRLDSKPLPQIYNEDDEISFKTGFSEIIEGEKICLVATGYMTHKALEIATECKKNNMNVGVVDIFSLRPINSYLLYKLLKKYDHIITLEEGFINKSGLDRLILNTLLDNNPSISFKSLGIKENYIFDSGDRNYLHKIAGMDKDNVIKIIKERWRR